MFIKYYDANLPDLDNGFPKKKKKKKKKTHLIWLFQHQKKCY